MDSPGSDPMDETAILLHFHCSQEAGLQHEGTIRPLAPSLHLLFNLLVHNYTWGNVEPTGQFETFDYLHL